MATTGRVLLLVTLVAMLLGALAYLRDPPWLPQVESGFRNWELSADGTRQRWTGGHASFFVRADASHLVIPLRTTFLTASDPQVTVTISIDDRVADRMLLTDETWRHSTLTLPGGASRRVRRIDIRVDRTRAGNRGVSVGEVRVE